MRNRAGLLIILVAACGGPVFAASCESLASLALPNATVTSAKLMEAGKFTLPGAPAGAQAGGGFAAPGAPAAGRGPRFDDLPAFCRVTATLKPSADSDIKAEFWLPMSGWNGRLQPTAAGVFLGSINYAGMANILRNGSATATSDNGHEGGSGAFALGHPEKLKDFAYRAGHETAVDAKILTKAFYGDAPSLTLMNECGGGGRTSLVEVQRYQDDLDLAMVGGLDSDTTHHVLGQMWVWQANHQTPESFIPPEKFSVLTNAALAACDARDGAKDGLIQDPTKCKFDPGVVECKNGDGPNCLTKAQVETARKIYSPVRNARTGEYLLGPFMPGSEQNWASTVGPAPFPYAVDVFRYLAFKDPSWDYHTRPINFDSDVAAVDSEENRIMNAKNYDLSQYFGHGGKLLLLGGWNDASIAPSTNYDYYNALMKHMGAKAKNDVRLFMVPGMGHCPGGNGPSTFDIDSLKMLLDWKKTNTPPDQLIAQHRVNGTPDRKVLVCAYPKIAVFRGTGSLDDPANFTCRFSK
jgi:feruloyl esterase